MELSKAKTVDPQISQIPQITQEAFGSGKIWHFRHFEF